MNRVIIIASVLIVFFEISCEQATDFYLGIYQQPELSEDGLHEGLNVFCVLRPDSDAGQNKSFAFVQQVWPALEFETFSILTDAEVHISELQNGQATNDFEFVLQPPDSIFSDTLFRPNQLIIPQPGQSYQMTCSHTDFPDAIGTCIIPGVPQLVEESIQLNGSEITLSLMADTSAKLIDVYLSNGIDYVMLSRVVPTDDDVLTITSHAPVTIEQGMQLMVFYYDANLATYYANSNTSVNFNKYRLGFTTLQSGYGVFGALNDTVVIL